MRSVLPQKKFPYTIELPIVPIFTRYRIINPQSTHPRITANPPQALCEAEVPIHRAQTGLSRRSADHPAPKHSRRQRCRFIVHRLRGGYSPGSTEACISLIWEPEHFGARWSALLRLKPVCARSSGTSASIVTIQTRHSSTSHLNQPVSVYRLLPQATPIPGIECLEDYTPWPI